MKLKYLISKIPIDKLNHSFYGDISSFVFVMGCLLFDLNQIFSLIAQTLLWYVYKEIIHDKIQGKGKYEVWDFIFSIKPYILMLTPILILQYYE